MLRPDRPALVLAPMDGITDAPMRDLQGATGAFSYAVSEFVRVSYEVLPHRVFTREIPEILNDARTPSGMPVQVQILGGDPERMAQSAVHAVEAGAKSIDINFGCPAPTVNRNDGGASLLRHPFRIRDIVKTVRDTLSKDIEVSAKIRLGWESIDDVFENARMVQEGGASWLTIHARTRTQAYNPPVYWPHVGRVREELSIPVMVNGDIWTLEYLKRCQDETGCQHFMIGRGALANPRLPYQISEYLGIQDTTKRLSTDWPVLLDEFIERSHDVPEHVILQRLKQWLKLAARHGDFDRFDDFKRASSLAEFRASWAGQPASSAEQTT